MQQSRPAVELWGGPECTVNRVGDAFRDQTRFSGHHRRPDDLEQIAAIGFTAVRYPALWERIAPHEPGRNDWRWTDERLPRLRDLGIRPIVGLVHHGSGPRYTGLLEDSFAPGLAQYARAVAARYPWVDAWTPVNEPLTTARFSALYGHWYPHLRDETAFWLALLNQVDAVRLSMAAIREVNPAAQLVQTEDLGRTYSTGELQYQAEFDNDRRWMTYDLLMGRLVEGHPLWGRLTALGFGGRLEAIARAPCAPDVLGVNHYLTSDRFLDGRCDLHPEDSCAGNGRDRYADVAAVRVLDRPSNGLACALSETWERYGRPIAVTESHNGCTREEQMRWTYEAWGTALGLREQGVDIRAVTAWSLLGSFDWDSLLTRDARRYEPGAFDVRSGRARPTAVARMLTALAAGDEPVEPALPGVGWWRRDARLIWPAPESPRVAWPEAPQDDRPRLLILGAGGALGEELVRVCRQRGLAYVAAAREELDLTEAGAAEAYLDRVRPWAVVNAAGRSGIAWSEKNPEACFAANTLAPTGLARACEERGAPYVGFSSHHVFGGGRDRPYIEEDPTAPVNIYGRSKAEADEIILGACKGALIIRSAAYFSAARPDNFASRTARDLARGDAVWASDAQIITPTYTPDLAHAALDLLIDRETGLWHLTNGEALTWRDFAAQLADGLMLDRELVAPTEPPAEASPALAEYSALGTRRGVILPPLGDAVERFCAAFRSGA